MVALPSPCPHCGGETEYVRVGYKIDLPAFQLLADEVPSVQCQACGRTVPADHVRPQLDAVIELAQDVPDATVRKDFTAVPLYPDQPDS